jgi:hypothetical protein
MVPSQCAPIAANAIRERWACPKQVLKRSPPTFAATSREPLRNSDPPQDPAPHPPPAERRRPAREPEPERPLVWRRDLARDVRGDQGHRERESGLHAESGETEGELEARWCVERRHSPGVPPILAPGRRDQEAGAIYQVSEVLGHDNRRVP